MSHTLSPSIHATRPSAKLLIIRFSSIGDIVQASAVPAAFRASFPTAEVDWLVREDMSGLLKAHPHIKRVIPFNKKMGLIGLIGLAWQLSSHDYTHVYDAHNNLRSTVVACVFFARSLGSRLFGRPAPHFIRRPKDRLRRWLFFRFRLRVLPTPFRGAESFQRPLAPWGIPVQVPCGTQFWPGDHVDHETLTQLARLPRTRIALAASAAWKMKRWPIDHWKRLINLMPEAGFVLLGGPEDRFLTELSSAAPERVLNLAGKLSLAQSASLLNEVDLVIANDTGILHMADQMERPALALIGPTAFGYPSHASSKTIEVSLSCKPCSKDGRGRCVNTLYQRCMVEILPEEVAQAARTVLKSSVSPEAPKGSLK